MDYFVYWKKLIIVRTDQRLPGKRTALYSNGYLLLLLLLVCAAERPYVKLINQLVNVDKLTQETDDNIN